MIDDVEIGLREIIRHRQLCERFVEEHPVDPGIVARSETVASVQVEWVEPPNSSEGRTILYFHSGGYVAGSPGIARQLVGRLAEACSSVGLIPAYGRAPESPFPAAVLDGLGTYRSLLETRNPEQVVVGGASAGGGLALAVLIAARYEGLPMPAACFALSPWTDLSLSSPAMQLAHTGDPISSPEYLRYIAGVYLGDEDSLQPLASPQFADLSGIPPLHIEASIDERLADDARATALRAEKFGVSVHLELVEGDVHTFPHARPDASESRAAIERVAAHIDRFAAA